jgi:molecular chaperone IbpA
VLQIGCSLTLLTIGGKQMTKNQLSIFNQLRPVTVGFDNVFDHFERMFNDDFFNVPTVNYPPYNIVKTGANEYNVEVALAGFSRDDVSVEFAEGILTIKSKDKKESEKKDEDGDIIHKGISKRYFSKSFTVSDDVEIKGAELKDGLLTVSMERIVPESKKARVIEIK